MIFKLFGMQLPRSPQSKESIPALTPEAEMETNTDESSAPVAAPKPGTRWKGIALRLSIFGGLAGIAGVILLPQFVIPLCGSMARQIQGRVYVGSMNRAQEAFYVEHGRFAPTWEELQLGDMTGSAYRFVMQTQDNLAVNYALVQDIDINVKPQELRDRQSFLSYVGAVAPVSEVPTQNMPQHTTQHTTQTQTIICAAQAPGFAILPQPQLIEGQLTCAPGTDEFMRF